LGKEKVRTDEDGGEGRHLLKLRVDAEKNFNGREVAENVKKKKRTVTKIVCEKGGVRDTHLWFRNRLLEGGELASKKRRHCANFFLGLR